MIIYVANYLSKDVADREHDRLWNMSDWEKREDAPRKECWMNNTGTSYTYGRGAGERTYYPIPMDAFIKELMERINLEYGFALDCCFLNGYKDRSEALGWHSDIGTDPEQPVISVSLGSERNIMFRNNETKEISSQRLGHGSLCIMPAGFQQTHEHKIPKSDREVGPRVSLTYRGMLK